MTPRVDVGNPQVCYSALGDLARYDMICIQDNRKNCDNNDQDGRYGTLLGLFCS